MLTSFHLIVSTNFPSLDFTLRSGFFSYKSLAKSIIISADSRNVFSYLLATDIKRSVSKSLKVLRALPESKPAGFIA